MCIRSHPPTSLQSQGWAALMQDSGMVAARSLILSKICTMMWKLAGYMPSPAANPQSPNFTVRIFPALHPNTRAVTAITAICTIATNSTEAHTVHLFERMAFIPLPAAFLMFRIILPNALGELIIAIITCYHQNKCYFFIHKNLHIQHRSLSPLTYLLGFFLASLRPQSLWVMPPVCYLYKPGPQPGYSGIYVKVILFVGTKKGPHSPQRVWTLSSLYIFKTQLLIWVLYYVPAVVSTSAAC